MKAVPKKYEDRFRILFETSKDAIGITTAGGKVISVNNAWLSLFGYTCEEIDSVDLKKMYASDCDRENLMALLGKHGYVKDYKMKLLKKDGELIDCLLTSSVRHSDNGSGTIFQTIIHDITEQKKTTDALRRREAILEAVANSSELLLWSSSWHEHIRIILDYLGCAAQVSRVSIFKNHRNEDETLLYSRGYEWVASGIKYRPENPDFQNVSYTNAGFERWPRILRNAKVIAGHTRDFPLSEQDVLISQDIKSILVIPIFVGNDWWGFIEFDECEHEREWFSAEIDALKTAAWTLGAAIQNMMMKKALGERDEIYRAMFEKNRTIKLLVNPETGAIVDANPAASEYYGYPPDILKNMKINDIAVNFSKEIYHDFKILDSEHNMFFDTQHRMADGTIRDVEINSCPIKVRDRTLVFSIIHDITDRKKAEEALRTSEERLRQIIDLVPHSIFVRNRNGKYILVNKAAAHSVGLSVEETTGLCLYDVNKDKADVDRILSIDQEVIQTGKPHFTPNATHRYPDGSLHIYQSSKIPFYLTDSGEPAVLGVSVDITEQLKTEEALRTYEEKYRDLVENTNDISFVIDTTGIFTYISMFVEKLYGYKPAELIGTEFTRYIYQEDIHRISTVFQKLLLGYDQSADCRVVTKSGDIRWIRISAQIINKAGKTIGLRGVAIDITKRKIAEETLLDSKKDFNNISEMASDPMFIIRPDGRIIDVNHAGLDLLGYTKTEAINLDVSSLYVNPEDSITIIESVGKNYIKKKCTVNIKTKTGEIISRHIAATALRSKDSSIAGYLIFLFNCID
ncbi:MAG: PAS domain S-box protein [Candidatus Latescibacteria bacterium]|nr:PAS domain S-box protein [Candidatus Latescibacterota bacterium]